MSAAVGASFEGNLESHDGLYEHLFSMSLPDDEKPFITDFDEAQIKELKAVFADQDDLLTRFRPYHE